MELFYFFNPKNPYPVDSEGKYLHIKKNISSEEQICDLYEQGLNFPYFGKNWDALADCLRDLDFIKEKKILIFHEDIPFELSTEDKKIYVRILFYVVKHWHNYPEHKIFVYFPECYKSEINNLISGF